MSLKLLNQIDDEQIVDAFIAAAEEDKLARYDEVLIKYRFDAQIAIRIPTRELKRVLEEKIISNIDLSFNSGTLLTNNSKKLSSYDSLRMKALYNGRRYKGKGVLIGILDSGIDFLHPDFQDENGNTRIKGIWDQTQSGSAQRTPGFGYGQVWDSTDIDLGLCTHRDPNQWYGHGSNVTGIAAGNGNSVPDSIADYSGYAPEASIAVVAIDFNSMNFTERVADGVDFLYRLADSLRMPCVINANLGTYTGSHDGLDFQARRIKSLIEGKEARAMVCATGNSGSWPAYHLRYKLNQDTSFTWFKYISSNSVFFEMWTDSSKAAQLSFRYGLDKDQSFEKRAYSTSTPVISQLGQVVTDTLINNGIRHGIVQVWRSIDNGRVRFQLYAPIIDSSQYHFRFELNGTGSADIWSSSAFGWSDIDAGPIPDPQLYPEFVKYQPPDIQQSMVSSWACLPEVITVGNIINTSGYIDYSGNLQSYPLPEGSIAESSSRGPNRLNQQKPDLVAPGERTFAAGRLADLNVQRNVSSLHYALAPGGYHNRNGGTSMASPAVAGSIALLLERCPKLDHDRIASYVKRSLKPRAGSGYLFGGGQLNTPALLEQSIDEVQLTAFDTDLAFCAGDTVLLSLPAGLGPSKWNNGTAGRRIEIDQSGEFHAEFTNVFGCPGNSDTLVLKRNEIIEFRFGSDTSICAGESLGIEDEFEAYLWSTGERTSSIEPLRTGTFNLITTDSNGCKWSDSLRLIELYDLPQPKLGNDTSICAGDFIVLYPGHYSSCAWSNGTDLAVIQHRGRGSYVVTVTDSNGCVGTDDIEIDIRSCSKPTALQERPEGKKAYISINEQGYQVHSSELIHSVDVISSSGQTVGRFEATGQRDFKFPNLSIGLYFVQLSLENNDRLTLKCFVP